MQFHLYLILCNQAQQEGQQMDFKNRQYRYLITGFNNGKPIQPYLILATIDELEKHLFVQGDCVRYYEEM